MITVNGFNCIINIEKESSLSIKFAHGVDDGFIRPLSDAGERASVLDSVGRLILFLNNVANYVRADRCQLVINNTFPEN